MVVFIAALLAPHSLRGRTLNDYNLNRPYADERPWHLGFSVGMNLMDLRFTHNGLTADDGSQWLMSQPDYSPGFNVGALASMRLSRYFSLRFTPGLYFGSRDIRFRETLSGRSRSLGNAVGKRHSGHP